MSLEGQCEALFFFRPGQVVVRSPRQIRVCSVSTISDMQRSRRPPERVSRVAFSLLRRGRVETKESKGE